MFRRDREWEKLKSILLALMALLLLVGQVSAMNLTESAYLKGISDGYTLGHLAITGQNNVSAENEYNSMVARLNVWMDSISYTGLRWANLTKIMDGYKLPAGLL